MRYSKTERPVNMRANIGGGFYYHAEHDLVVVRDGAGRIPASIIAHCRCQYIAACGLDLDSRLTDNSNSTVGHKHKLHVVNGYQLRRGEVTCPREYSER